MIPTRVIGIDWSGAKGGGGKKAIWLAEVQDGALRRLESGRTRTQVIDHVIAEAEAGANMVVGLDFAFSLPDWFLQEKGASTGRDVWRMVADRGERWLSDCEDPFWGRPGRKKPDLPDHFRRTEIEAQHVTHAQPKSVFQIGGAGAVGTGSLRGMPHLHRLAEAGFSIWPFDDPGWPLVLEIYPRLLTGAVRKSDPVARRAYLSEGFPEIGSELRALAASTEDALDAAVSAVVMARHLEKIEALRPAADEVIRREGRIWWPGMEEVAGSRTATAKDSAQASSEPSECPFCDVEASQVLQSSRCSLAITDAYPVTDGHTLVVPKRHVSSIFALDGSAQQDLWGLVADVRARLMARPDIEGCTIGINDGSAAGQTLEHAHVHVIPRRPGDMPDPRGGVRWVIPHKAVYWHD